MKDSYSPEALCKNLPDEFAIFLNHVRRLEFEERPEYNEYRKLFLNLLDKNQLEYDLIFDWMIP